MASRERDREGEGGSEQTDIDSDGRRAHYRLATANANADSLSLMQRGLRQEGHRLSDPASKGPPASDTALMIPLNACNDAEHKY